MGVIATFSYANWVARYPEFASVTEPIATGYFAEASIYHANDGSGPVKDVNVQTVLLNMMTAHIAARYAAINGKAPSSLVGRINSASIGPISAGTDGFPGVQGMATWLLQTKYGSDYWYATSIYRTFRYRPGRQRLFDPPPYGVY